MEKTEKSSTPSNTTWPGAFGVYRPSHDAVMRNLDTLLLLWAASLVGGMVLGLLFRHALWLRQLGSLLLGAYVGVALAVTVLAGLRGQQVKLESATKVSNQLFFKMVLLELLIAVTAIVSLLLLIVPFFFIVPRLSLATYLLVDQKLGVIEAYKASWHATSGNVGKVWGIIGVSILMVLPVFTIIGILATAYLLFMYQAATAFLYVYLQHQKLATKE